MTATLRWQKSSFSGGNGENCIEVAAQGEGIVVRERDAPRTVLTLSPTQLRALLRTLK
ncbi:MULTISPECIES: DUF397 domain-containing protein [Streptomyces]|uniref:DUF397 domain-containing protein n=1 Tax=Streptomyces luteosporeus TaxID=173856 RepID=A0ABN3TRH2_9ACTN